MLVDGASFIRSVKKADGSPPKSLRTALKVNKLVAGSSADIAGVAQGDFLVHVNGVPANAVDYCEMAVRCEVIQYTFYKPVEQIYLEVNSKSAALGMEFIKTEETIYYEYSKDVERAYHEDLYPVWNERNWRALLKITNKSFIPIIMWLNCLVKTTEYFPEYLLSGAALYDAGKRKKGMRRIKCFEASCPETHSQEQDAIIKYYYAQELLHNNQREEAIELLHEAFLQSPYDRIAEDINDLTGEKPVFRNCWPGEMFPCDYYLQRELFGDGWIRLSSELKSMRDDQLFIVCMLGGYRVNRFYNEFMHRYLGYLKCFPQTIHGLHVITSDPWQENHPDYFENEQRCLKDIGDVILLHDPEWELWEVLEPHGSPAIYVLDNDGIVLHEGQLTGIDLWEVFAQS